MKTLFRRPDRVRIHRHGEEDQYADLYVCTVIFNPIRFRTRWKLYQDFAKHVKEAGAKLWVAEIAYGNRDFVIGVDDPVPPDHLLQLTTTHEMWHKENAINLLTQRLPIDWQYMALVDADIHFARQDWANETVQQLQHYKVVQMWSEAQDLNADYESIQTHHSFVYSWTHDEDVPDDPGYYQPPGPGPSPFITYHPGWAWAWRRQAWDDVGGLIDWAILGAADNHQAHSLIGNGEHTIHPDIHGPYRDWVLLWQQRAERYIQHNVGYVPGKILHYHHGPKKKRRYWDRWRILVDTQFNPIMDLKRDWQGLYQGVVEDARQVKLRDLLREYFRGRDEDSPEV